MNSPVFRRRSRQPFPLGVLVRLEAREVPAAALPHTLTAVSDYNGDGVADYRLVQTLGYDARGYLTSTASKNDYDGDGVIDTSTTLTATFGKKSSPLEQVIVDEDGSGNVLSRSVWTWT
jgi:hypothetical protein